MMRIASAAHDVNDREQATAVGELPHLRGRHVHLELEASTIDEVL